MDVLALLGVATYQERCYSSSGESDDWPTMADKFNKSVLESMVLALVNSEPRCSWSRRTDLATNRKCSQRKRDSRTP